MVGRPEVRNMVFPNFQEAEAAGFDLRRPQAYWKNLPTSIHRNLTELAVIQKPADQTHQQRKDMTEVFNKLGTGINNRAGTDASLNIGT